MQAELNKKSKKNQKLALSSSHRVEPAIKTKETSLHPESSSSNPKLSAKDKSNKAKHEHTNIRKFFTRKPTLRSVSPTDGKLRISLVGLLGSVQWTKWASIASKLNYSIFHEDKDNNATFMKSAVINGVGCRSVKITKLQTMGLLGTKSSSSTQARFQEVYVDGVQDKNAYFIQGFAAVQGILKPGDIVLFEVGMVEGLRLRCYIESVKSTGKSFTGIVLGCSEKAVDMLKSSAFATMFTRPVLCYAAGITTRHKSVDVPTGNVISVAPFTLRMLGKRSSDRFHWYEETEAGSKISVCDWSKAIVVVVAPSLTRDPSASSHHNAKGTQSKKRSNRLSFRGGSIGGSSSNRSSTTNDIFLEDMETIIISPHAYNNIANGKIFYDSKHLHSDEIRRVYKEFFRVIRTSALVDPRRHLKLPAASMHTFSDRPDMCSLSQGTVHHLASGLALPPSRTLLASISIKDIKIQHLHALIQTVTKKEHFFEKRGLTPSTSASPWEAKLKFAIEVANLSSFNSNVQVEIEKNAVGGSKYAMEHQRAFLYPRHERMDPRIANTRCEAVRKSFSIAKECFETGNGKKTQDKFIATSNPASNAAVMMNLIATEPWDTDPDTIPTVGHDSISWKINTNNSKKTSNCLDSLDGVLKLYLRDPNVSLNDPSDLNSVISKTSLRVELKVRDTKNRSKQYIVGSTTIPLKTFIHQRWMSFELDSKKGQKSSSNDYSGETKTSKSSPSPDDFGNYMARNVTRPLSLKLSVPPPPQSKDQARILTALQQFNNDPLKMVLEISGSTKWLKHISKKAKHLLKRATVYSEQSNQSAAFEEDEDEKDENNEKNEKDEKDTKTTTIWIEKQYKHHGLSFPMPKKDRLGSTTTTSMMNNYLDEKGWQNCMDPLFDSNKSSKNSAKPTHLQNSEAQIVVVSFCACMNVCDKIDITPMDMEKQQNLTAHAVDGQEHSVVPNTSANAIGVATSDEFVHLRRRKHEEAFMTITKKHVHLHGQQPGITLLQSTSKVQLRSLSNWKRCQAFDLESQKEIDQVSRVLCADQEICEFCLEQRGIPLLNASLPERVAAINTGANIASKLCLSSKERIDSHCTLVAGRIKQVNKLDNTVDVVFSTPNHGLNGQTLRIGVPTQRIAKLISSSSHVSKNKLKNSLYEVGDVIETMGLPQLVTYMQHGKGYMCSPCFDATIVPENSCWIELSSASNKSSTAAVVALRFFETRDGDNQKNKQKIKSLDRMEFGRHPLDRTSLRYRDIDLGKNVKQHPGTHTSATSIAGKNVENHAGESSKTVTLVVHRQCFDQPATHSVQASKLLKLDYFEHASNPDINSVSKIISVAGKISTLLKKHGPDQFQEACTFLKCRASDFAMRNKSFDFRGTLQQALAPLRGLLSMAFTMLEDASASQETAILTSIFGSELPEDADERFWSCSAKIVLNYTTLFFGDVRHETLVGPQSKRIGHTATKLFHSTVIIGGANVFATPNVLNSNAYSPIDHPNTLKIPTHGVLAFDHFKKSFYSPNIGNTVSAGPTNISNDIDGDRNETTSLSRLDHTAIHWKGNIIIFGGHCGATIDGNGNIVPGKALCDLHLLDTLTSPWTWHHLLQNGSNCPKIGRYAHSAFVRKIEVSGVNQDVMIICGGMRSPERFMNESHLHAETYNILSLEEEIESIRWLACDTTELINNTWRSKDYWVENMKIDFSAEKMIPLPLVYNYIVSYGNKGNNRTLIFGGSIHKKHAFGSDRISYIYDLEFNIEENEPTNTKETLKLLSNTERKMLAGNHHRPTVLVNVRWVKHSCTGPAPEIGGRCRGAAWHPALSQNNEVGADHQENEIIVYDSRTLFALNVTTYQWRQLKMLGENMSRPIFGSTLTSLGNGELIRLGGFSHTVDSLDTRINHEKGGFEYLVSPQLIMTSTKADLIDLPTEIRKNISKNNFAHDFFEHEFDELFFTTNFESTEPSIESFLVKLYQIEDSPCHFLKPCTKFVAVICDIFDPYTSGFVHINTYNSVCGRYGLVRQLLRARLRYEFVDTLKIEKWPPSKRKKIWMGEENLENVIDYVRASTTFRIWSRQYVKEHQESKVDHQNREDWAKFDGTMLSCSPFVCIELYQLILLETSGDTIAQSDISSPPLLLLDWVLMSVSSKDGGGNHSHIDFSCIVESSADFLVSVASCRGPLEQKACQDIIYMFKSLSELFVLGKNTRSDVTTLKKMVGALYFLSNAHGQRLNLLKEIDLVPFVFLLRDTSKKKMKIQFLLNELFQVKIDAGSHPLVHLSASMYKLVKTAESSLCDQLYKEYKRAQSFGTTPFALDTTQNCWRNVVLENHYLRKFEHRKQICIDFIYFVRLNSEHHRSLLTNQNASNGNNKRHNEAQSNRLLETIGILTELETNAQVLRDIVKKVDEQFLEIIFQEIQKKEPKDNVALEKGTATQQLHEDKDHLDPDIETKKRLLNQISYIKQRKGTPINLEEPTRSAFIDAEYLAKKLMKKKTTNIFSDSRQMRGFMLLLLGNLDSVLEGVTSLQTAVTVQWRILRIISYVFVAASKKSHGFSRTEKDTAKTNNSENANTEKLRQLLFPMNDGVSGYAIEFFSYGNGLVSLCRVLSSTYQIRIIASSAGIAMATTKNASSYQLGPDRSDAIYFTQNTHGPESSATTAVLLLLDWLIVRLKNSASIRYDIRKMVRQGMDSVPRFEKYHQTAKRTCSDDTILALCVLASCPHNACCGNGSIIADLASKVLNCSLEQLKVPKHTVENVLAHLRAVQDGTAVLNHDQWLAEKRERKSKIRRNVGSEEAWWKDPKANQGASPYDAKVYKDGEETETSHTSILSFLSTSTPTTNGSRDNENCCTLC